MALYSVEPSRLKGECAKRSALAQACGALALGGGCTMACLCLCLCLVLSWAWAGHFIFISAAAGHGRRGSRRCVIPSNIMLDGGRARTGEDMPFEMVVAFFFFFLSSRTAWVWLVSSCPCPAYLQGGLCSARKILCCLLAGTRFSCAASP